MKCVSSRRRQRTGAVGSGRELIVIAVPPRLVHVIAHIDALVGRYLKRGRRRAASRGGGKSLDRLIRTHSGGKRKEGGRRFHVYEDKSAGPVELDHPRVHRGREVLERGHKHQ